MQVPLLDLKAQYDVIREDMLSAVTEVIDSTRWVGGPKVEELEERIAAVCQSSFAVGVSSGTDAILNSLMSLGIGPGDEVITTPFTFFATAGCIVRVGARPVFVDIDPKTYNIDPGKIEGAVTDKTKAILPVHLFGQMAEMDSIMTTARKHDLLVIEDAAQSIMSSYKGRAACSIGMTGCLSFYPTKNLGGIGDGGMIVTNDERLYERMKVMRDHGQRPRYHYHFIGGNFRLDSVQAAALVVKLNYLESWNERRRARAAYYDAKFAGSGVEGPYIDKDCVSVYNLYCVRVGRRDEVMAGLQNLGVGCGVYYPVPLHMHECFSFLGYHSGDFPESEKAAEEILALPMYPELTSQMQDYVVETLLSLI
ncbi:MAG: DegT/DnrJ/EryC1/StrS family aminotransferase [Planctomycetota bacterium]